MDISLDKPGFGVGTTDAEVHFSDPPRSSGSSSSTSGDYSSIVHQMSWQDE